MALRDAVLEVVEQMENDRNPDLLTYARQLRLLVKASDNAPVQPSYHWTESGQSAQVKEIEKKIKLRADTEEKMGERMVTLQGGSCDGDMVSIDSTMPIGARTLLNGQVYQLQGDNKLHFDEKATAGLKSG